MPHGLRWKEDEVFLRLQLAPHDYIVGSGGRFDSSPLCPDRGDKQVSNRSPGRICSLGSAYLSVTVALLLSLDG